ncbi:T9SS type A sorting domain-containing protein [Cryomorpha ignava]|uniref:T9SS type A sorting domain-containing protein n=1 Tax=Cryomorpha ignava TaxID=101383 RepID=A0A7K3WVP5_9FLAO|nr:T9SS type A sorting domain-containing protein [Cryomorpha ignava]NEN25618.1 T9SS type A sorting domain-containing protein [Cryomorpha ignava]
MTIKVILIFLGLLPFGTCNSQMPTYTIDPNFNTEELFRDVWPVFDLLTLADGRYLVGGAFSNYGVSPVSGFGMIFSNGSWDSSFQSPAVTPIKMIPQVDGYVYAYITGYSKLLLNGLSWGPNGGDYWSEFNAGGTHSPYNVARTWDIYQMENSDLILCGAITTDTLQPELFRGITRIHADGTIDPTFPIIDIAPNNSSGAVRAIFPAPDGSWYISGSFTAINGHETNHVAKLTSDFYIDTTFISPFMYDGPVNYTEDIILVDNQSRVWVSGYDMRLLENPNDTIQLCRLLPDGNLDTSFPLIKLSSVYPAEWMTPKPNLAVYANELEAYPGNYIIYGSFSHYNDTLQPCIAVVNDAGVIQDHFFQGQGATKLIPYADDVFIYPAVYMIKQLNNGELLIGGAFSEFMGETHYSVVKLKQGFVGVQEAELELDIKIYPNPVIDVLRITSNNTKIKSGVIYNALGQKVDSFSIEHPENHVDISGLKAGIYFVEIRLESGYVVVKKFVKG